MAYLSFYRKYRSRTFDDLVGQEHVTTTLKNAIERGRIAHAYLFSGPRGTGKTSTARIFAKALNCAKGPSAIPCNECEICLAVDRDALFDVIEIDAASNRGIDDIRDLKEKVRVPPSQARTKVYIIDEAHMLTREAFNALLKTLEEPPKHVLFILATTEPQKMLPTILSRCQRFDFRRLTDAEISGRIRYIATNEGFTIDDEAMQTVVHNADGSMRDAISLLDQLVSFTEGVVTAEAVNRVFGLVERSQIEKFMNSVLEDRAADAFALLGQFFQEGKSFSLFLRLLMEHLRDLYFLRLGLDPPGSAPSDLMPALRVQAERIDRSLLAAMMDDTAQVEDRVRWETYPRILIELLVIKLIERASVSTEVAGRPPVAISEPPKARPAAPPPAQKAPPAPPRVVEQQPAAPKPAPAPPPVAAKPEPVVVPEPEPEPVPVVQPEAVAPVQSAQTGGLPWNEILAKIRSENTPTYIFMIDTTIEMDGESAITILFPPDRQFQMEQLQERKQIEIVERTIKQVAGKPMRVKCRLSGEQPAAGAPVMPVAKPSPSVQPAAQPAVQPDETKSPKNLSLFDTVEELFPGSEVIK